MASRTALASYLATVAAGRCNVLESPAGEGDANVLGLVAWDQAAREMVVTDAGRAWLASYAAAAHLVAGIAKLSAQPHGDGYAYYEQGTRAWYSVSESDVAELGARLAADPGAYSEWCADTQARDLTADLCHAYEAAHPGRVPGRDLRSVVETAQRDDGPGATVADIDAIVSVTFGPD